METTPNHRSAFQGARIDHRRPTSLYRQLEEILIAAISRGEFGPGDLMPGERELEEHFQVSRITVRRALSDLVNSGYLRREAGRGTFVIRSVIDDSSTRKLGAFMDTVRSAGHGVSSRILFLGWEPASSKLTNLFGAPLGASLLRFDRLILVDDRPASLVRHWVQLSSAMGDRLGAEVLERMNVWDALEQECGLVIATGEQTLQAVGADPTESELLQIPGGTPLMLIELVLHDSRGQTLAYVKLVHVGSSYKLHTTIDLSK